MKTASLPTEQSLRKAEHIYDIVRLLCLVLPGQHEKRMDESHQYWHDAVVVLEEAIGLMMYVRGWEDARRDNEKEKEE